MTMYLYSGKCRVGAVGHETPFVDMRGEPLRVGDIVVIYTENSNPRGLTAVVSDEFISYSDGTHVTKDGPIETFVMGIKNAGFGEGHAWNVLKVKDGSDAVDGEHWKDYGFRYSLEDER